MSESGMLGVADCPREGCPSDTHDVTWIRAASGDIIGTIFTCRVCGAGETWDSG